MNQEWIAVTDRKQCGGEFLKTVQTLAGQGLKTIILREKDLSEEEYGELAARCMEICRKTGASLTLHKYFHAARGLGQPDQPCYLEHNNDAYNHKASQQDLQYLRYALFHYF